MDNDAYTPLGSISAHEVMNSPRWCEPRMEESLLNKAMSQFLSLVSVVLIVSNKFSSTEKITPSQVVKVVHDDSNEEVDHDEGAEEDEGDKVDVGDVGATALVWVN